MKLILVVAVMTLINFAQAQEKFVRKNAALVAPSMSIMPCTGQGDATNPPPVRSNLRETARLFLVAGQREAALRIFCEDHSRAGSIPTRRPFGLVA